MFTHIHLQVPKEELPVDFAARLHRGDVAAVLDCVRSWELAEVTAESENAVFVHYINYAPKWDEWVARNSGRIR